MNRLFDALTFGPTRRRRSLDKQFRQLSEAYRSGAPLGGPEPPRGGLSRRPPASSGFGGPAAPAGPGMGRLLLVLAVIIVVVGAVLVGARSLSGSSRPAGIDGPVESFSPVPDEPSSTRPGLPPAGVGSSPDRLLPVVAFPPGRGGYAFENTTVTGGPVTWDPCRPITVVTRTAPGMPTSGDRLVQEALSAVQQASGLKLVQEGNSNEVPTAKREAYQPQRYGRRWAPVLIAWSDPKETPELAGRVLGLGGASRVTVTPPGEPGVTGYVTGSVTLDGPEITQLARSQGTAAARAVVEHELGHLLGLAHVPDRHQLMYSETEFGVTSYQSGDRRGLAQLGAGACTPGL
jgi:hypothetical protein